MDAATTFNDTTTLEHGGEKVKEDEGEGGFKSPFAAMYKAKTLTTQEQRRDDLLQSIKLRRHKLVNKMRNIGDFLHEEYECKQDEELELMDIETYKGKHKKTRKLKFKNKLMMSEWFREIPSDLESNWLVKLSPVGVRSLVIAYDGETQAYNLRGKLQAQFSSHLPGGCQTNTFFKFTVLDCIFSLKNNTYYILDVLAWNSYSLKNCDTAMRFYWIKSKLEETPELKHRSTSNPFVFSEVHSFPAELPLITDKLSATYTIDDEEIELDGVLFYHRETIYLEHITPLVGWLKPFMIPEMLQIPINEIFMEKRPKNYISLAQYLESRKYKIKESSQKMEY
ncbi:hypothetical protein FQA39_LY15645 [Lamprigera yunnana]|nr:hypothetical protein FQA39_LY15645 [Lamprigera yunnana]